MTWKIFIAHADGEQNLAEELAIPLEQAGYKVIHYDRVLVGNSIVEEAQKVLSAGEPVVICGTVRAAGTQWAHKIANAVRAGGRGHVFVVQMEQEAYVEPLALGERFTAWWADREKAARELVAALGQYYPVDGRQVPEERELDAEKLYRKLALKATPFKIPKLQASLKAQRARKRAVRTGEEWGDLAVDRTERKISRRGAMALGAILERFIEKSPVSVMARLAVQRAVSPEWVDSLFEEHRERQYTRELMFSSVVEMMSLVAMGLRPSLHAAAKASNLSVSTTAVYDKVNRVEGRVVRALVQQSAERLSPVVSPMQSQQAPLAKGYRVRIVDGNHLPATEKRVKPLRGFRGAALPGHSLVVYAPEQRLVVDMVPIEDAHAQERTGMPAVLEQAQAGDLWMADRNFCTTGTIVSLWEKQAHFILREHGRSPSPTELGKRKKVGRIETGVVYEQDVQVEDETGRLFALRRIELQLDEPTEDGDTVIRILTNAPKRRLSGKAVARLYRKRWSIEGMFQRLESVLQSELRTLGQPKAALLAFGTAVVAYNVLSVLQTAVEAAHPQAQEEGIELSAYFVAIEARAAYEGMLIAVPEQVWVEYETASPAALAQSLIRIAANAQPKRLRKHPRGPKKKTKTGYVAHGVASRHVSTARVLAAGHV